MRLQNLWYPTDKVFIDGQWQASASGKTLDLFDPSTGAVLAKIARGNADDIDRATASANAALSGPWSRLSAAERGRLMLRLSNLILERADDLAIIEAHDVGKPLKQARADALAMARYFEFYGGAADKVMGETIPYLDGYTVYTIREPIGVTGHIVPWNYPMQILGRSVGAALAMGNCTVLKPAEQACLTALALGSLASEAGFPDGVLNIVPGLGDEAGAALSAHPDIHHISFTGSVATGRLVQTAAAQNVIPATLELGGKSPQLVFEDADLEQALPFLVNAGVQNAGQTCSASSRILVARPIFDQVAALMAARYAALKTGPAMEDLDIGPLISSTQQAIVAGFLERGADLEILAKGQLSETADQGGYYQPPVLLKGDDPAHELAQDEIFGPVQLLLPFGDEDEALAIANGTKYGLVASIWSKDGARQMRLARGLRSGQVFINNYGAGGGVELPFGGVGHSGHGREKGFEALYGFSSLKTVAALHG